METLATEQALPDLSAFTLKQLRQMETLIPEMIAEKQAAEQDEFLALMQREAAARGLDFASVVSAKPKKSRKAVSAKYMNPDNPSQTWAGRGKAPKWVTEFEEAGGKRDDLLIEKVAA